MAAHAGKTRFRLSCERAQKGGEAAHGSWIEFAGYQIAKTVASIGYDWVLIDCEHGEIDDTNMYLAINAIASVGCSPVVRIPGTEAWMIKRALDAGAHGLMVPMCETKEQAEAIVQAVKYPSKAWPTGKRGVGTMFGPKIFDQTGRDYLSTANDNVTVIVQIETRAGLENCEAIASVPGIDALFIGPNDLCSSLGYFAFDHPKIPEVQEATARILKATKDNNIFAGHFCLTAEIAAQRVKQGFEFVNLSSDLTALENYLGEEFKKYRGLVGKE